MHLADLDTPALLIDEPRMARAIAHMQSRVAHHMIPRYVRIIDDLPKTPTAKVEKHVLRAQGITTDTWDRESAGIAIRRERF